MRRDVPEAYEGFTGAVRDLVDTGDEALLRFASIYAPKQFVPELIEQRRAEGETDAEILDDLLATSDIQGRDGLLEEFHSDLMGRAAEHKDTWQMVTEEMARQSPNVLRAFLHHIEAMAKRIKAAFSGKQGFQHMDDFVLGKDVQELEKNLQIIRRAAAQALGRYAGRSLEQREALFAQRNPGAVRLSEKRGARQEAQTRAGALGDNEAGQYSMGRGQEKAGDHKLEISREERELADKTKLTREELTRVRESAKAFGLPIRMVEMEVRRIKARFPESAGWAPLTFLRVDPKTMSKKAKEDNPLPSDAVFFEPYGYQFHLSKSGKDDDATHQKRVDDMAAKLAGEIIGKYLAAQQGDKSAQVIMRQAEWYQALRGKLRATFGGFGDFLAQLLGPTSANNPVEPNFKYGVEALKLATSGEWDNLFKEVFAWKAEMEAIASALDALSAEYSGKMDAVKRTANDRWGPKSNKEKTQYIKEQTGKLKAEYAPKIAAGEAELKKAAEYKGTMPLRENGKQFGMATKQIVQILAEKWGDKVHGDAPKTKNYYQNIMGRTFEATIDVWAARTLRRLANDVVGSLPRIPPVAETAVAGEVLVDGETSGSEFGFGQEVFRKAVEVLKKSGIEQFKNTTPDAVQAMVWFIEKETWATRNWTTKIGEEGSIEHEMLLAGYPDREQLDAWRVAARKGKPNPDVKAYLKKDGSFNEKKYEKDVARWEEAKQIGKEMLVKIEGYPDRFVAGATMEIPNDRPTNSEMAGLAREIEEAAADPTKVMAARAQTC